MSKDYDMSFTITGYDENRIDAIIGVLADEWKFQEADEYDGEIRLQGEDCLDSETSEEDYAEISTIAVWKANGKFCTVSLVATYIGGAPWESYCYDEDVYNDLMKEPTGSRILTDEESAGVWDTDYSGDHDPKTHHCGNRPTVVKLLFDDDQEAEKEPSHDQ